MLASLIESLEDYSSFSKPSDADEIIVPLHRFANGYQVYTCLAILIFGTVATLESKSCEAKNIKNHTENICGLLTFTWMPFAIDYPPAKQIYFAVSVFSAMFLANCSACCISVLYTCIRCIISKMQHLMDMFSETFVYETVEERRQHLVYSIRYHIFINK